MADCMPNDQPGAPKQVPRPDHEPVQYIYILSFFLDPWLASRASIFFIMARALGAGLYLHLQDGQFMLSEPVLLEADAL